MMRERMRGMTGRRGRMQGNHLPKPAPYAELNAFLDGFGVGTLRWRQVGV
jgi:hypothetical protein